MDHPDFKQFMDLCLRLSHKYNTTDFNSFSLTRQKVKQHTRERSLEIKNDFKTLLNTNIYKDSFAYSLDTSTDNINKISYIGMIVYLYQEMIIPHGKKNQ